MQDERLAQKLLTIFTEQANKTEGSLITEPHLSKTETYVGLLVFDNVLWDNCDENSGAAEMTLETELPLIVQRVQDMIDSIEPMTHIYALQERIKMESEH